VFHVSAALNKRGAIWAAQRVPHDHVAVVANNYIIRHIDFDDHEHENFYWSDNLLQVAHDAGFYRGPKEGFDFAKHMAPDNRVVEYFPGMPPQPMYMVLRTWAIQRHANPSEIDSKHAIPIDPDPHKFNFSVPVQDKLSLENVMNMKREVYNNTAYDLTQGIMAGPHGSPNREEGGKWMYRMGQYARAVSISRTSYGIVSVAHPPTVHGVQQAVVWFAADMPLTSVFVPFHAASLLSTRPENYALSKYGTGSAQEFKWDSSAWWAFDFVSNFMNTNYFNMSRTYVFPLRDQLQSNLIQEEFKLRHKHNFSSNTAADFDSAWQANIVNRWWELASMLIVRYNDGYFNFADAENPQSAEMGLPKQWLDMISYDRSSIFPQIVTKVFNNAVYAHWTDSVSWNPDEWQLTSARSIAVSILAKVGSVFDTQQLKADQVGLIGQEAKSNNYVPSILGVFALMWMGAVIDRRWCRRTTHLGRPLLG
jgi:dipeptidase